MYTTNSGMIIPSKKELQLIHRGRDGDIYKYLDYAIKFVKVDLGKVTYFMTIKKVRKFIEVFNHELLVSPKEIIYDRNQKYVGYSMKYIENKGIKSLSCDVFLESAEKLRECFDLFTENGIEAFDTHGRNILTNEKIFLIDFDRFNLVEKSSELKKTNITQYEDLIWHIIQYAFFLSFNLNIPYTDGIWGQQDYENWLKYIAPFNNWAKQNGEKQKVLKFFKNELSNYKTVEEYLLNRRDHIVDEYSLPF